MPIALLACLLSFASQDPLAGVSAKPINLTIRARPLRRLLPELSASVGTTLTVAPNLADEVVLVHAVGRPAREVVTKVAETLFATWVPNGDGLTLTRTAEDRRRMVADDFRELTQIYEEAFGNTNKALILHSVLTEEDAAAYALTDDARLTADWDVQDWEAFRQRHGPDPESRLQARVQGRLLRDLLSLRANERRVFSSQPTSMQVALPASLFAACRQYLIEEQLMAKARRASTRKPADLGEDSLDIPQPTSKAQDLSRVLVVIAPVFNRFDIEIKLYDSVGTSIARSGWSLSPAGETRLNIPAEPLKLSPTSQALYDGYRKARSSDPTPLPSLLPILLHPEANDPADAVESDAILHFASLGQRSVVAWIPDCPDVLTVMASTFPNVVLTLRSAWELFYGTMETSTEGSWLRVRPTFPSQLAYPTLSRSVIGSALRNSTSAGRITLESLLDLKPMSPMAFDIFRTHGRVLYPHQANPGMEFQTAEFLAKLDATQVRDALGSGLSARRLTPDQMSILNRLAYGTVQNLKYEPPLDEQIPELLEDESTEYAPNGLSSGVLTLRWTEEVIVSPQRTTASDGGLNRTRAFNAEELAQMVVSAEKATFETLKEGPDLDRLRIGTRRNLNLLFTLDEHLKMEDVLTDVSIGESTPWEKMPTTFKRQYESHLAKLRGGSGTATVEERPFGKN